MALPQRKPPGETWVLYFGGDYVHNGVTQERYTRETFAESGWRVFFVQASRFLTIEALAQTDLLILNRVGERDAQGFSTDGVVEDRPEPDPFLPPPVQEALVQNVERGMGLVALHCTAGNVDKPHLMELLGVRPHKSGAPTQSVRLHGFDPRHPITRGMTEFDLDSEENLPKEIVSESAVRLFESTGQNDGNQVPGGWCLERGNGRVVVLMGGHTDAAYTHPQYRKLQWRAAHWAMGRETPDLTM